MLDKTGTLTEGRPSLRAIDCPSRPDSYVLRLAAALEKGAAHPVALAIVREADKRRLIVPEAQGRKEEPGQGVRGSVEGRQVAIGSAAWLPEALKQAGVDPEQLQSRHDGAAIEFSFSERATFEPFIAALLTNLAGSDFQIVFSGATTFCTVHHHHQLWWTTRQRQVAELLGREGTPV